MSKNPEKVKPGWRKFEQLIERIEIIHAPKGAIVKSPDRLRDLTTKKSREVDATVRYKVGTVEILIAFECRKRGEKGGVTWIEQLSQKRISLGISSTVAVSEKGFTKEAMLKAKQLGIKTRVLKNVEDFNIESALKYQIVETNIAFRNINFYFETPVSLTDHQLEFDKVFQIGKSSNFLDQREFLMSIVNSGIRNGTIPNYRRMPANSKAYFGFILKADRPGTLRIFENGIQNDLHGVSAEVTVESVKSQVNKTAQYQYQDIDNNETRDYLEFEVGDPENPDFKFIYNPDSDAPAIIFNK